MSARTLRPVGPHLLIEPDSNPKITATGIHLPETYTHPPGTGTIVAIGNPRRMVVVRPDMPCTPVETQDLMVGLRVAFRWLDGQEVEWENRQLKFLRLDQLIGVLE